MSASANSKPVHAREVAPRAAVSFYPEPFKSRMTGRQKRQLGEWFGLKNFGVNLTTLAPGAQSSIRHAHTKQDEFIYVVQGRPTLCTHDGKTELAAGMCAGFRAGDENAHHLRNETSEEVLYLEIGDRTPGDEVNYPDDDLRVVDRKYVHKDGTPY